MFTFVYNTNATCPVCNSQPKMHSCIWGNGKYFVCDSCGFGTDRIFVETTVSAALECWIDNIEYFLERKEIKWSRETSIIPMFRETLFQT
jgi:transcription elongation factor Elf1